jgi:hypothetical protein
MATKKPAPNLLSDLKRELLKLDPVSFCQNHLSVDGKPLDFNGGWKFWSDVYRLIGLSALRKDSKPVVVLKGRQVGATTLSTAMELYFATSGICGGKKPPARIVHCFPDLGKVQMFAKEKFSNMMRTSVDNYVLKQLHGFTDEGVRTQDDTSTLTFKQFKNECRILLESNANNATRLQSTTNDIIFYDEVQHMYDGDIGNANRTLTASNYGPIGSGFQAYYGTPLQKGSYFWKVWESSDQRFFHLKCTGCAHYFQLYEYGSDSWEQIWITGTTICCPSCSKLQDKSDALAGGKWVATKDKMENGLPPRFVGYHISQLLIPYLTKEAIIKEKPGVHPTNTDRIYRNEILGEFYSGSDLPMSEDIIYSKCRELDKSISFGVSDRFGINTFLGIDWGGKSDDGSSGGKSFTTFTIISVDGAGTIRIENSFKLKKNDLQHKKDVVDEMFRRFGIKLAVADLGHGNDSVPEIQKGYGARFIGCWNSSSLVNPYKYEADDLRLTCNSNIVLEEVFSMMRKGKILFPWASFEHLSWLVEHCCSMERETRIVGGQVINRFVKGTGPNDGLMSIMYAYLAYKFHQTKGFSLKPHMLRGGKSSGAILAHLPKI